MPPAPRYLRQALIEWVDNGMGDTAWIPTRSGEDARPISWLIGKLWACTDVMTRSLCADLLVPQDSTFAQGVRALRANGKG